MWWLLIAVAVAGVVVLGFFLVRVAKALAELRQSLARLSEASQALDKLRAEGNGLSSSIDKLRRK